MNAINKEYPEGQKRAEMILVRMLRDHRSWSDHMEIVDALWNLRFHAKSMRDEQNMFSESAACQQRAEES